MLARNYDPLIGRFMQVDPLAMNYPSITPYGYVLNNPLGLVDPDGRQPRFPFQYYTGYYGSGKAGLAATFGTIGSSMVSTLNSISVSLGLSAEASVNNNGLVVEGSLTQTSRIMDGTSQIETNGALGASNNNSTTTFSVNGTNTTVDAGLASLGVSQKDGQITGMNASLGVASASFTTDGKISAGVSTEKDLSFSNLKIALKAFIKGTFDAKKVLDETSKSVVDMENSFKRSFN